jgi:radical SAM protein with 4Fe4S-binding SPASM domain
MSIEGPQQHPQAETNPYLQLIGGAASKHRLTAVHWELTYRCNEQCTHCYLDVLGPNAEAPGELSTRECLQIVDQLVELGALNISLSGGELLVRKDWYEIARYIRSKRVALRLFTNGILINAQMADRIADLHPYTVEISLYSARPEVHDGITRIRRSWELTTRAARLLREREVRVLLKTPLMQENVKEIEPLQALADEIGASFRLDPTLTTKLTGEVSTLRHRVLFPDLVEYLRPITLPQQWLSRDLQEDHATCGIGTLGLVIDPHGNVFPCTETRIVAGNLRHQPLREIWQESPVWQEMTSLTLGELPVCRTCELRNLCTRCHGLAMVENGDLRGPALVKCREALARRQVLVEQGALQPDFPIPQHLQAYAQQLAEGGPDDLAKLQQALLPSLLEPVLPAPANIVMLEQVF